MKLFRNKIYLTFIILFTVFIVLPFIYLNIVFGLPVGEHWLTLYLVPREPKAISWKKELVTTGLFTEEGHITADSSASSEELKQFYLHAPEKWGWKKERADCKTEIGVFTCIITYTRKMLTRKYMLIIPLNKFLNEPYATTEIKVITVNDTVY